MGTLSRVAFVLALSATSHARAQPADRAVAGDIEVPGLVVESVDATTNQESDAIDLANIVKSAVKGVSTVQEAPAIVTVVTETDIKERQFRDLPQIYDTVPGWNRVGYVSSLFHAATVRGQVQAVQFLRDGLSMFDPFANAPASTRVQPMEIVKQVEMITGPGGVLWGANSLLGILNVITKDAEDVDGVEVGGTLGDGIGDRSMGRVYAMVGQVSGKWKVFAHASVETYRGAQLEQPLLLYQAPLPEPNSANIYGPLTASDQARSVDVNLDAKVTYGKLALRISAPFGAEYHPLGISGNPSREHLYEDASCTATNMAGCVDTQQIARKNRADQYDRYVALEYRTRFAGDSAGLTARAYGIQFVSGLTPMLFLAPSALVPGGLALNVDYTSYRVGGAVDGDVELGRHTRLLYGAEAFDELKPDTVSSSIEGPGTQSTITTDDLSRVAILCPREWDPSTMKLGYIARCPLTFAFPATRTVLGAYVDPQWRPTKSVLVDVGARLQAAPKALGSLSYDLNTTAAATLVWNFLTNWHLKLNYAQGFRPPVFNDAASNGESANIAGDPNLLVERSSAEQIEVNARIFKGERRVRELSFRVDGSYTKLDNLIQITTGEYKNSGQRGLTSGELLARLFLQGGHRIELGYSWLRAETSDRGLIKSTPQNWFNFATVFSLVANKLTATSNLKVSGAIQDPNRLVEYRDLMRGANGIPPTLTVAATDLVLDRLPPVAELSLGLSYTPTKAWTIQGIIYDAFAGHNYEPDVFSDYEPHLEYLPNPYEGFRAYVSGSYHY